MKNIAVIFAGGIGARMGYRKGPKQFMKAAEKPILIYTLEIFEKHKEIDLIYLSVVSTHIEYTQQLIKDYDLTKVIRIVSGGNTAIESIQNTLQAIVNDEHEDAIVLIHDGVRPIVSKQLISNCINLTRIAGNAVSCVPATETICSSLDGVVVNATLNRKEMYILQAPQCFMLKNIFKINMESKSKGLNENFIDQASLAKHFKQEINLTQGIRDNIKITTTSDYEYFSYLILTKKYYEIIEWKH